MDLNELREKEIEQLKKKGKWPQDEKEIILHLVEEVGEVCEAIREKQSKEDFESEIADVLWQLNKLCEVHNINLEKSFLRKLDKNGKR